MGKKLAAFVAAVAALLVTIAPGMAAACGNAVVMATNERVKLLVEAEAALDEGYLDAARSLAREASRPGKMMWDEGESDGREGSYRKVVERAMGVVALSYVRDATASAEDLASAEQTLRDRLDEGKQPPLPTHEADRAEAQARIAHMHGEAFDTLKRLHDRDLLGSPHALGALNRLARARGDRETAAAAYGTCTKMIGRSETCEGRYTSRLIPYVLVSHPLESLVPSAAFLVALGLRLRRRRAASDPRAPAAPWVGFAPLAQTLVVALAGVYVLTHPRAPVTASVVAVTLLGLAFVIERRAFLAAVRRGAVPGFVTRAATTDDDHLPALSFFTGARATETLERVAPREGAEAGYREPARTPLYRLAARGPLPRGLVAAGVVAAILGLALLGASTFLLRHA
ncbi:MAG: hypothetical protein JST00_23730 [Deltaproteobacteria bacterium]|nr:hypothetical protein [Deltaproteobacteria bacterium]